VADAGTILDVGPAVAGDDHVRLRHLGHHLVVCPGPGELQGCPLLTGGPCPQVDTADGAILRLDLDDPVHRALLRRYRDALGGRSPVWVVVGAGQDVRYPHLLEGLDVSVGRLDGIERFASQVAMAAAVRQAMAGSDGLTRFSARQVTRFPGRR
jgi:hypothetical protein